MYLDNLIEFVKPYYKEKDIMHDLSHIERVMKSVEKLKFKIKSSMDKEAITYATYFHGFIYTAEKEIMEWLRTVGMSDDRVLFIIKIAWESQKNEVPVTLEGKILHDAHMIEGGKTYLIVKSLITGSVRGQSLEKTILFIEKNIIGKGCCYLPEAQRMYDEQQKFASKFIKDLKEGID